MAAIAVSGCSDGLAECERKARVAHPGQTGYHRLSAREEPGETPAMTYWIIEYRVTERSGLQRRANIHCGYMRDLGEAEIQRTALPRGP